MTQYWNWGQIKADGFTNASQVGYLETQPDAGVPYRRQTFTDTGDIIQGTFTVSLIDYNMFRSWYKHDIKQGSIPFDYYDCRVDATRTARIIGAPSYSSNSNYYDISIKLYLEPTIIYQDVTLVADEDTILVADTDTELIASIKLRL